MDTGQELMRRQPVISFSRGVRARRRIGVVLAAIAMSLAAALPAQATAPAPELTLQAALALMPDTDGTRASGVWYADYARAAAELQSDAVDVFIAHETESVAVASDVKGYSVDPFYTLTAGLALGTK